MTSESNPPVRRRWRRGRGRRRLGGAARLTGALLLVGFLYTAFAPGLSAQDESLSPTAAEGQALYDTSCITCHGPDATGVDGRGPSLLGVGAAAVEFQVSTGRMPMARQEAQALPKPPVFDDAGVAALAAYIQELGGGPELPAGTDLAATEEEAAARGGELFRINCANCHGYPGGGGALSSGAFAPNLTDATDRQIWAAMLSGPQNMPVFGDSQLTPEEKQQVIAYIQRLDEDGDPGGVFNLGRLGPTTEGLAIFLVGIVALVFTSLWIAGKS
jgi:ubiquinol-cytochrome c reductase cytochrome c subunit